MNKDKTYIIDDTNIRTLNAKELFEFRNTIDYDSFGFIDELEGSNVQFENQNKVSQLSNTQFCIIDNLTQVNFTNKGDTNRIKYIVIHYTAGNGDTAAGNSTYFKTTYRGASAHYFVDDNSIYRCVNDDDIAWHCGGSLQGNHGHKYHNICKNSNSIGIEMCSRKNANGIYYISDATVNRTIQLIQYLMNKYNVPESNVIRHFDVTGKNCPAPYVDDNKWNEFKKKLIFTQNDEHWAKKFVINLINKGFITDESQWVDFDSPISKALVVALLDNITGGNWKSNEADKNIHWAQPCIISLCGKGIITDYKQWLNTINDNLSNGLLLALICNITGGLCDKYKNRITDHWARNCLDTLCDRGIIVTPSSWVNFDGETTKGQTVAILSKICE